MNAVPALDGYLLDLLGGGAPAAPAAQAHAEPEAPAAVEDPAPLAAPSLGPAAGTSAPASVASVMQPAIESMTEAGIGPIMEAAAEALAPADAEAAIQPAPAFAAPEREPAPIAADAVTPTPSAAPVLAPAPKPVHAPAPTTLPAAAEIPAARPAMPAMPASLPAHARPVFELLQTQAQDQARSPHGDDRRRASDRASRWLRMRCDDQHYALELLKVQEVVLPATLLPLRGAARHMLGVMNLRGQVVPVIDLGLYLGREAIASDSHTRIAVLEEQGEILGLRVSAVEDVTTLTEQQIEPPDNTRMCRITHPLFRGVARLGGRTVILLDASELLR